MKGDDLKQSIKMEFKDSYFDFVWSWGVIHHSANTNKIINEIVEEISNHEKFSF